MLIHLNRLSSGKVLHVAPPLLNWILPGTLISRQSQTTKRIYLFAIQFPFIPVFLITYLLRVDTNSESGIKFNYPHFRSLLLVVSTQEALASSNNSIKTSNYSYSSCDRTEVILMQMSMILLCGSTHPFSLYGIHFWLTRHWHDMCKRLLIYFLYPPRIHGGQNCSTKWMGHTLDVIFIHNV